MVGAHIDLSNCIWSMVLPEKHWLTFRVLVEGELWAFRSPPFGWSHSRVICQAVPENIVRGVAVMDVLVLIYYDDVFIIGYGKYHVHRQMVALA